MIIDFTNPLTKTFVKANGFKWYSTCPDCKHEVLHFKCRLKGYEGIAIDCGSCEWVARMYKPTDPELKKKWDKAIFG